jgi:hypothetical protein
VTPCWRAVPASSSFASGGVIHLKSDIVITEPFLTIAGQTAPGDGIVLSDFTVYVVADHVIIRHLRFRAADSEHGGHAESRRSLRIGPRSEGAGARHVIVDHVSASWGIDQTFDTKNSADVTVQWSMISESLSASLHVKAKDGKARRHGLAALLSGGSRITYHHNLFAHHQGRVPMFDGQSADFVNNVVYHWSAYATNLRAGSRVNFVKNYYKFGPENPAPASPRARGIGIKDPTTRVYLQGNCSDFTSQYCDGPAGPQEDQWAMTYQFYSGPSPAPTHHRSPTRFPHSPVAEDSAAASYARILAPGAVGATRGANPDGTPKSARDATDARVVASVINRTGGVIDKVYPAGPHHPWFPEGSPSDLPEGTFPAYETGSPYTDSDGDGIADPWEVSHGLDPLHPGDGNHYAANGYTHVENYLNELAGDRITGYGLVPP